VAVRAAMGHAIPHRFDEGFAGLRSAGLKAADDAAHKFELPASPRPSEAVEGDGAPAIFAPHAVGDNECVNSAAQRDGRGHE